MPTYEYACAACKHEFEEFQSITAPPLRKCPKCGRSRLQRLIGTGSGVIFKGSGFYETDYRSESYKKAAQADAPTTDAGATDTAAKSESPKTDPAAPKPDPKKSETPAPTSPETRAPAAGAASAKPDKPGRKRTSKPA